jgi:hypothetical protein
MTGPFRLPLVMAFAISIFGATTSAQESMTFSVKGGNPGGKGGYTAEATLTKLSKWTAKIRWVAGAKKQVTEGIAVRRPNGFGSAYGPGLYALALYEIDGKKIEATWTQASKPEESGTYALKGSAFEGKLSFSDGTPGSVTFTPKKNGLFDIVWELQSGRYEGIGLQLGNMLVAASGDVAAGFGVGIYSTKDDIHGLWATTVTDTPGTEAWSAPGAPVAAAPVGDGLSVKFAGDTYELKENKSAPGQVNAELREYLRKGETWDNYSKMVALRLQNVKVTAEALAKSTLEQVQKSHPGSYVKELDLGDDTATIFFIIVKDDDAELNLFRYQKAGAGIASAQFVMRNKPPFNTQAKFKAEQDKEWDQWMADAKSLATSAADIMSVTAGKGVVGAAPAASGRSAADQALAKAISADFEKCGAIAQKFMNHLKAGETEKAVALMSERGFRFMSREKFLLGIQKSNEDLGALKSFKPDKAANDFGVKDGVMTFTLEADSEYTNAKVRSTLKFIRNDKGEIEFVGYSGRTAKE